MILETQLIINVLKLLYIEDYNLNICHFQIIKNETSIEFSLYYDFLVKYSMCTMLKLDCDLVPNFENIDTIVFDQVQFSQLLVIIKYYPNSKLLIENDILQVVGDDKLCLKLIVNNELDLAIVPPIFKEACEVELSYFKRCLEVMTMNNLETNINVKVMDSLLNFGDEFNNVCTMKANTFVKKEVQICMTIGTLSFLLKLLKNIKSKVVKLYITNKLPFVVQCENFYVYIALCDD